MVLVLIINYYKCGKCENICIIQFKIIIKLYSFRLVKDFNLFPCIYSSLKESSVANFEVWIEADSGHAK